MFAIAIRTACVILGVQGDSEMKQKWEFSIEVEREENGWFNVRYHSFLGEQNGNTCQHLGNALTWLAQRLTMIISKRIVE